MLEHVRRMILAAALCVLTAGCGNALNRSQKPELLYLNRAPYSGIYVEIDSVEGCGTSSEPIEAMRGFLATYCDKPDGIRIVRKSPIPRSEAKGATPSLLAARHMQGPPAGDDRSAYLYVLFYNSAAIDGQRRCPYVLTDYPCAIFVDEWSLGGLELNKHILIHEAGHVLGLTHRPTLAKGLHCPDPTCVMYPSVGGAAQEQNKGSALNVSSDPSESLSGVNDVCPRCKAEFQAIRHGEGGDAMRFDGPVLLRQEPGYWVAMLPDHIGLYIRPQDTFNCRKALQSAQQDLARLGREPQKALTKVFLPPQLDAQDRLAIERAKSDPNPQVRELAGGIR